MSNRIINLFQIQYPIIQAGMVWCSGWRLAAAVSSAGGLGIIGAGSMCPDVLRDHIRKAKQATDRPFAVNVPLLYADTERVMQILVEESVKITFTSAGNPALWTGFLKDHGIAVVHVVSNTKFAKKAEACGADAVVAEGFEAGGHNGREETTTLCLVPMVADAVQIPVIAAGGISSGRSMLAAMALGAEAVQIGSAFAVAEESSAHPAFKERIIHAAEGDTRLRLQKLVPVRLLKNSFEAAVAAAEAEGADEATLSALLGRARAKLGMFEGNMEEGELEIGQVSAMLTAIRPAAAILEEIWQGFLSEKEKLDKSSY
ncbi:NAD(P)H-dependent flavin oxidoreductase [Pedobacter hartonius]|uniref:Enoyl-[acyl-carrier protein] reductase II n=1 Tax=Pedobacter hartonius TaxID=425514 RepID=A0A1H4EJZ3_9SPHI|nr:nitronate monooxygenase [Pedobacter hartonius]SEA85363.1 enoyl-[acyl-carrier protein] reductase II [Pedobacter hartonius]